MPTQIPSRTGVLDWRPGRRPLLLGRSTTWSVLAVAACVAAAGCGGSGSSPSSTDSTAPAVPAAAGHAPGRTSARDIANRCGAQSAGDPSKLIVCLASSGVQLGADVELHSCLQAAGDSKAVIACVQRAVH